MNTRRNRLTKAVSLLMAIVVGLSAGYGLSGSSNTVFAAKTDTTSSGAASTGSTAPKCIGSITIDTRSYTMAPGNIYDVGIKLVGAQGKAVCVYSSRTGIAAESKLANGNYRITAISPGVTYVIVEVYNSNGKLLNHASVKVTVQKGAHQGGVASRAVSLLYDDDTKPTLQTIPSNGSASYDATANAQWIVNNLGFLQSENPEGAYYNPNNKAASLATITVGHSNFLTVITFKVWGGNTDSIDRKLLQFYLPNSYTKLYNMIETWNNSSSGPYVGKHYTLDDKDVVFYWYEGPGEIQLQIGDKYVSQDTLYPKDGQ